jgi:hypothetical protein
VSQRNSGYARQPNETYETPPWVVRVLLPFLPRRNCAFVWDPAGPGTQITDTLTAAGYNTALTSDDFMAKTECPHDRVNVIVCNPPWGAGGRLACQFIKHALALVPLVAMLLRIDFDSGRTRVHLFRDHEYFAGKVVLLNRVVWFEREGAPGPSENHSWFIWDRRHHGPPTIRYATKQDQEMQRMPRRKRRDGCGVHWADPPSSLCPGCEAYEEHYR